MKMGLFHIQRFETSNEFARPIHVRVDDIQAVFPSNLGGCVIWLRAREDEIALIESEYDVLRAIDEGTQG